MRTIERASIGEAHEEIISQILLDGAEVNTNQGVCDLDGEKCHAETCSKICSIFKNTDGAQ